MKKTTILLLAIILFFGGSAIYKNFEYNNYYTETEKVISSNLFDKNKAILGYELYVNGLTPVNETAFVSDYIPVKPNTTYTKVNAATVIVFYDIDKNYISYYMSGTVHSFTTPENTAYLRLNGLIANIDIISLNEGTEALPYEPYRVIYEKELLIDEFLNDYNQESTEYGKVVETGFKNGINVIKETVEFLKDSIPSKDNVLGPLGAIVKRLKELFPSFFMPNPIIK